MFSNNDDMQSSSQLRTGESEDVGSKQDEFYSKFGSRAAAAIRRATISDTIRKAKEDHKKAASPLTDPGESGNTTVTKPSRNTNSSSEDERVPPPSSGPGMKNGLPLYPPPRQRRRGPLHQANRVFRPRPSPERIQLNHQNFNHRTFREERNTQNRPPRRACNRGRKNRRHYRSEPRVITYNYNFGDPSIFLPLMNHTGGRLDQLPFFQQPVSLMNLPMYGHMKQYGHSSALAPCYPPKPVSVAPVNNVTKTAPVRKIIEMHPEITQDSYASVSDDDDVMIIEDNILLEKSFANVSLGNQPPVLQSNAPNSTFREIVCIDLSDSE